MRPERLYGFYPEMGGTFLSPVFSAHFGENKSDKLRGLGVCEIISVNSAFAIEIGSVAQTV